MADTISKQNRSRNMASIRSVDTRPELIIRRGLHRLGYRYSLHSSKLPGTPDMVLRRHNALLFIHGCFWHKHTCHLFRWPKTRTQFWKNKINRNVQRDADTLDILKENWRIGVIWECSLKGKNRLCISELINGLASWIESTSSYLEIKGVSKTVATEDPAEVQGLQFPD